jgi:hypothetical protein
MTAGRGVIGTSWTCGGNPDAVIALITKTGGEAVRPTPPFPIPSRAAMASCAYPSLAVEPEPNGANLLRLQAALCANNPAGISRTPIFGCRLVFRMAHGFLLAQRPKSAW